MLVLVIEIEMLDEGSAIDFSDMLDLQKRLSEGLVFLLGKLCICKFFFGGNGLGGCLMVSSWSFGFPGSGVGALG